MRHFHMRRQQPTHRLRRGSIIVLTAMLMIVFMALMALSIDIGYVYTMKTQLDRSVDAAALAGTSALIDGQTAAQDMVVEYLARNPMGETTPITADVEISTLKAEWLEKYGQELQLTYGYWNPDTHSLENATDPSAVRVVVARAEVPLFFARVLGHDHTTVVSSSVATYQPRDIMLVLDLSASMNDDSELKSISRLGRDIVESNLAQIYYELGSPQYGVLPFAPEYATVRGMPPTTESLPQITVEYQGSGIHITSTKDISNVLVEFEDGTTYQDDSFAGGSLETTLSFAQTIQHVYVESGTNAGYFENTNGLGELFDFTDNNTFVQALGLDSVQYPYPSGSWSDYVSYVKASGTANANAGYRFKLGNLSLVNYWLERQPSHSQTPDLWKVSAQPLATVKDAVALFADYVREVNTRDRIGLVVYNSSTGEGTVEVPLSFDLDQAVTVAAAGKPLPIVDQHRWRSGGSFR